MNISKENLLEELQSIEHCLLMTHENIVHDKTRDYIIEVLERRISELEDEVDATISAEEFGADMLMDVA